MINISKEIIIDLRIVKRNPQKENILRESLFSLYSIAKFFLILPSFKSISESVNAVIHKGSAVKIKL